MPIIGLTHTADGQVRLRRSVTTKVAIGLPPREGQNYPARLDHFVILKKGQRGSGRDARMEWEIDAEKMRHYGDKPRELWIVLLDDDPDQAFRTEYAWYVKTGRHCYGDGERATRRTEAGLVPHKPCANAGCPDLERGDCKPSGDLYFMLADFPALGSICRLHTSSYQSIAEIRSALEDLRSVTGGRLLGLRVKLFVRPEKNVYDDPKKGRVTGTKFVLGLELAASDMRQLATDLVATAQLFEGVRKQLGGRVLEIDENEEERGDELTGEFYPGAVQGDDGSQIIPPEAIRPAPSTEVEKQEVDGLRLEAEQLMGELGFNQAKRTMMLGQYQGQLPKLLAGLRTELAKRGNGNGKSSGAGPQLSPLERALGITDEDIAHATTAPPPRKQGGFDF